jgi:tRNA nucleotidyltransferase (CCA-adding enzyme)
MSDYMFVLENHLTSQQSRVLAQVEAAAADAGMSLYLTGGAIRDMLGGFAIRDLDFTVEGNAPKLAKTLVQKAHATVVSSDDNRKSTELLFPGGVTVEISMARQERYAKPGGKAHVTPATIHEDLRGRDFTINALALSLNKASRGLLLDPTNGLSELERKELRAVGNYTLYDSPIRVVRLIRFKVRLGFQVAERTQLQYENARSAEVLKSIPPGALLVELRHAASEANVADLINALEQEKLLDIVSPALTGAKVNHAGFAKLQKALQLMPFGAELHVDHPTLFFNLLSEKLSPKERSALVKDLGIGRSEAEAWQKLDVKAKKLEKELQSPKLQKASLLYQALVKVPGEQLLYLLVKSGQRLVQDRIRNYLQKYLPMAQEVTDKEVEAAGASPGSPKFQKLKEQMIATKLDSRPKKPVEPVEEVPLPGGPRGPAPGNPRAMQAAAKGPIPATLKR